MFTLRTQLEFYMAGVTPIDTSTDSSDEQDDCSICLVCLEQYVVKIVVCGHKFHTSCVLGWFEKNAPCTGTKRGVCPNCRRELYEPDPESTRRENLPNIPPSSSSVTFQNLDDIFYALDGLPGVYDSRGDGFSSFLGPPSSPYLFEETTRSLQDPGYGSPLPIIMHRVAAAPTMNTSFTPQSNEIVGDTIAATASIEGRRHARQLAVPPFSSRATPPLPPLLPQDAMSNHNPIFPNVQHPCPQVPESYTYLPNQTPQNNPTRLRRLFDMTIDLLAHLDQTRPQLINEREVFEQLRNHAVRTLGLPGQQHASRTRSRQLLEPIRSAVIDTDPEPVFEEGYIFPRSYYDLTDAI
ncbi:zf-RING-2 multi-domain protein [Pyrenophora tritici-repentis]|nr:zf-RING-2 multi-domain protein [Pyrenophora tritici-repentis]